MHHESTKSISFKFQVSGFRFQVARTGSPGSAIDSLAPKHCLEGHRNSAMVSTLSPLFFVFSSFRVFVIGYSSFRVFVIL
jgi:hypothetical protein